MKIKTINSQILKGGNTIVVNLNTKKKKHGRVFTDAKAVCADGDVFDYQITIDNVLEYYRMYFIKADIKLFIKSVD